MKWHWIAKEEESTNLKFLRGKFPLRASLYSSMTYHISLIKTPKSHFSQRNRISLASPVFLQHPFRMNIDWSPSRRSQFGVAVVSYFPPTLLFSFLFFFFFFHDLRAKRSDFKPHDGKWSSDSLNFLSFS